MTLSQNDILPKIYISKAYFAEKSKLFRQNVLQGLLGSFVRRPVHDPERGHRGHPPVPRRPDDSVRHLRGRNA